VTASAAGAKPPAVRRKVVGMAFLLSTVLYMDRAALGILAPAIRRDLGLGPLAMGWIFSAFVWGYALCHIPAGILADRLGARRLLSTIVILWSAFTACTGAAWNLASMLVLRFLFGAAESGASPGIMQSFARWIPVEERARSQGIYLAGMSAGAAVAPPLATLVMEHAGWRSAFLVFGALGMVWAAAWYWWYRDRPPEHPAVSLAERALLDRRAPDAAEPAVPWSRLARSGNLWAILLMYFSYGYTGYIYITWFPSYLIEARRVPAPLAGLLASVPSLLGLLAKPAGGWWSDRLAARRGLVFGRRAVGICGFCIGALAVWPGLFLTSPAAAVFFLSLADAGAALAHGVCFAVCLDVGLRRAGTVSALMLTMGSLGNVVSALVFGSFLSFAGSWKGGFLVGMAANLAGSLLWLKINPKEQLL
jgi:MFS family permease